MLKLHRPPTHKVDAPGVFISIHDDAWDMTRVDAEVAAAHADAVKRRGLIDLDGEEPNLADLRARHPVGEYFAGTTRYQPDAPAWDLQGKPTTASDYLKPGAQPTRFIFRRVAWREYEQVLASSTIPRIALGEMLRRVLVQIDDPSGALVWTREADKLVVPDDIMQALWSSSEDRALFVDLAIAAKLYCGPLLPHEGKRSGCGDSVVSPPLQPMAED